MQEPIDSPHGEYPSFLGCVRAAGCDELLRARVRTLQVNVGRRCNQACRHCHVAAGPHRTESISSATVERVLHLLTRSPAARVLDLTGGAPELSPAFRRLVSGGRDLGREVIDRCNLTVLFEAEAESLPAFMAEQGVHIVASLPCYSSSNVDAQRGMGTFDLSIRALRLLNHLGYAMPGTGLALDLVYNPAGAFLPPAQGELEQAYRDRLTEDHGIRFDRLLTLANLPTSRFAEQLSRSGQLSSYYSLLVDSFNPATVPEVMCRTLVSVGVDGALYDCDFNQMLSLPAGAGTASGSGSVWAVESLDELVGTPVATGFHCFGCTAGAGSSCGGALTKPVG